MRHTDQVGEKPLCRGAWSAIHGAADVLSVPSVTLRDQPGALVWSVVGHGVGTYNQAVSVLAHGRPLSEAKCDGELNRGMG
jgi:hypothetical protein